MYRRGSYTGGVIYTDCHWLSADHYDEVTDENRLI